MLSGQRGGSCHVAIPAAVSAGDLYSDSRNRLSAKLAEMLLLIKHNLEFVDDN